MVGVAGKSKGCHTCRRRKIRCDQGRPICGQCVKSNRECEGYEKARVFLNNFKEQYQPKLSTVHQRDSNRRDQAAAVEADAQDSRIATDSEGTPDVGDEIIDGDIVVYRPQYSTSSFNIPRLIGFEHLQSNQALRNFLTCSLPTGAKVEVPLSWLYSILDLPKDRPALPLATAALSYGWTGHVNNVPMVVGQARSYYVDALQHLHRELTDDPCSQSDAILATMECLALYEIFEFGIESGTGWLAHLSGVEAVIKLRGPQMHIACFGHKMFMFFRMIGTIKAILCRQSSFLAFSEWQNIPWTMTSKNIYHQFLDLAAEVPALLERADKLIIHSSVTNSDSYSNEESRVLLAEIVAVITRMNVWTVESGVKIPAGPPNMSSSSTPKHSTDTTEHQQTGYILSSHARRQQKQQQNHTQPTTDISPLPNQSNHPRRKRRGHNYPSAVPHSLGTPFDTLQTARLLHTLWSVQLTLYTTLYSHPSVFPLPPSNPTNSMDKGEALLSRSTATALADKITLWSDFCTQDAWQSFGPVVAVFTLRAALAWYALDRAEEERHVTTTTKNLGMLSSLFSGPWSYSRQAEMDKCLDLLEGLPGFEGTE